MSSVVKLTPRQQKLRAMHTQTTKNFDGKPAVELVVGCQYFTLDIGGARSRRQLEWHKDMIAIALSRVGRVQKGKP